MVKIEIQCVMDCSKCGEESVHNFSFNGDLGPYDRDTYKAIWLSKCCEAIHLISGAEEIKSQKQRRAS